MDTFSLNLPLIRLIVVPEKTNFKDGRPTHVALYMYCSSADTVKQS